MMRIGKGFILRLASFLARRIDRMKDSYPKKKVKNRIAFLTILITGTPLFLLLLIAQSVYNIVEIIVDLDIIYNIVFQLVFIVLYVVVIVFLIFETRSWWDLVDIVYEPLKTIEERTSEKILQPVFRYIIKLDIIVAALMIVIFLVLVILMVFLGFTPLMLIPLIATIIIGGGIIGLTIGTYFVIRGILIFLFDVLWKKLDDKFDLTGKIRRKWDDLKYVDIDR